MTTEISYGADKALVAFWALLLSPAALICGWLLIRSPALVLVEPFLMSLMLPLIPVMFASRFRATFTPTEFVYRRWGPAVRVFYSDIRQIEVTNVTPIAEQPIGAFVVTKHGQRLPFWPKLFPIEAVNRFLALGG